jgi:hypothetical protein
VARRDGRIGADALGLDWTVNLGRARALVGDRVALQGNLDPAILFAGPEQIRAEVERSLTATARLGAGSGHVFNLGHGISQFTPPESVTAMVEAVHDFSRRQRAGLKPAACCCVRGFTRRAQGQITLAQNHTCSMFQTFAIEGCGNVQYPLGCRK